MGNMTLFQKYINENIDNIQKTYSINPDLYLDQNIKRGLRNADGTGVIIGISKVGSVQGYGMEDGVRIAKDGKLYYRGISVEDIVEAHKADNSFGYEEVAYLLMMGQLPTREQLNVFNQVLNEAKEMPAHFTEDMILKNPSKDVMNQLARSVLALYTFDEDPENTSLSNVLRQSMQLIARFPIMAANVYAAKRHYFEGKSLIIHNPSADLSLAENLLLMTREDMSFTDKEAKLLDLMMILHAEHSSNNSTFVCRALSSSGTDTYSAIAGAVGSLKGPLHGGANAKSLRMFNDIKNAIGNEPSESALSAYLDDMLDGKVSDGSGKIYGLGHAVYTLSDPRAVVLKRYATELASEKNRQKDLELLESVEKLGVKKIMERKHQSMPLCANIDLYSGLIYDMLGIPVDMFTPIFACARMAGWCAHRLEEITTSNRIMRPAFRSAVKKMPYVDMDER